MQRREGGVRWTLVRVRAYRRRLMSVRVVVGLLVSRRRVGALGDSTVGLVSRVPSRMCWVGVLCCGISFLGHLGAGDASCWHEVLRRGAVLLASGRPRASVTCVRERRRWAAGARHGFSRATRRVERRDVVDALCGRGVVMRRAGRCDSIASRPARRFADDDRSDLVVVTCFCLVSECVSGVSECITGGRPGGRVPTESRPDSDVRGHD